jgi:hypothetical protein
MFAYVMHLRARKKEDDESEGKRQFAEATLIEAFGSSDISRRFSGLTSPAREGRLREEHTTIMPYSLEYMSTLQQKCRVRNGMYWAEYARTQAT